MISKWTARLLCLLTLSAPIVLALQPGGAAAQDQSTATRRAAPTYEQLQEKMNAWTVGLAAGLIEGAPLRLAAEMSAWDSCLVMESAGDNVQDAATKLLAAVTTEQIQAWTTSDPRHWANESFKITESAQTKYCIKHGNSCDKPSVSVRIDQTYIDANVHDLFFERSQP